MAKININLSKGIVEKQQQEELIVGIDLGTTNSLVAFIKDGQPFCIKNESNSSSLLPSVVYFDEQDQPLIGSAAKSMLSQRPDRVIFSAKRLMGKSYQELESQSWFFSYKILDNKDDNSLVKVQVGKKFYNPIELSALILSELKKQAEKELKMPVSKAVITVPAYFDDNQRQATRDAGKLAGLEVLRVVNEPTAAALAYGLGKDMSISKTVAVYDLGGGTFDLSILRLEDGFFEVLSSNGDTFLGGDDIDKAILSHFRGKYPAFGTVEKQEDFLSQLRILSERAKKQLSEQDLFQSELFGQTVELSRRELEQLIQPLLGKTLACCKQALADAQLSIEDIDEVLMVGGSTRSPFIREKVGEFFQKKVNTSVNPDEVVALGAAVQANILAGKEKNMILLDVTPLSLGIETVGGLMDTIIARNSKIPTSLARQYTTSVDGQKRLKVSVYQGERELVQHNRKLGEFILNDIPPMPAGLPKIEIQFMLDADGILKVSAKELRSNVSQSVEVRSLYKISDTEMAKMLKDSVQNAQSDIQTRALIEAQTEAKLLLAASEKFLRQNQPIFDQDSLATYLSLCEAVKNELENGDKNSIQLAMEQLNEFARPLAQLAMDHTVANAMQGKKI